MVGCDQRPVPDATPQLVGSGRYALLRTLGRGSSGEALLCARWPLQAGTPSVVIKRVGALPSGCGRPAPLHQGVVVAL